MRQEKWGDYPEARFAPCGRSSSDEPITPSSSLLFCQTGLPTGFITIVRRGFCLRMSTCTVVNTEQTENIKHDPVLLPLALDSRTLKRSQLLHSINCFHNAQQKPVSAMKTQQPQQSDPIKASQTRHRDTLLYLAFFVGGERKLVTDMSSPSLLVCALGRSFQPLLQRHQWDLPRKLKKQR